MKYLIIGLAQIVLTTYLFAQGVKSTVYKTQSTSEIEAVHTQFPLSLNRLDPDYYEFNPESVLRLGSGFNVLATNVALQSPFEFDIDTIENVSSLSTQLDYILITSYNQLKEELKMDVKFSASYGMFGSVDGGINFYRDLNFESSSVYLLVKGETEYGRIEAKPKFIKPEVVEMLYGSKARKIYVKSGFTLLPNEDPSLEGIKAFKATYGSKIPIIERHGAKVYILIEIANMSKQEMKDLTITLNADLRIGLFSADMKSFFNEKISKKMKSGEVKMKLLTKGGDGFKHLGRLLSYISSRPESVYNGNPLGTLGDLIAEYLEQFNFGNSAPIGFFCPDYSALGLKNINQKVQLEVYNELLEINHRYLTMSSWISRIDNILNPKSPISIHVEKEVKQKLAIARSECYTYILTLRKLYQEILDKNQLAILPEFKSEVGFSENDLNISQITFDPKTEGDIRSNAILKEVYDTKKNKRYYEINGKHLREILLSWESDDLNCPTNITGPSRLVAASLLLNKFYKGPVPTIPEKANDGVTVEMNDGLFSIKIENDFLQNSGYSYQGLIRFQNPICGIEATHSVLVYVTIVDLFGNSKKYELGKAFPWCPNPGCANYSLLFFPYKAPLDISEYK